MMLRLCRGDRILVVRASSDLVRILRALRLRRLLKGTTSCKRNGVEWERENENQM